MDTVTYPDPRVAQFIVGHFLAARVHVKESPQLVQEYLIGWTPNVVVADDQGKVVANLREDDQQTHSWRTSTSRAPGSRRCRDRSSVELLIRGPDRSVVTEVDAARLQIDQPRG